MLWSTVGVLSMDCGKALLAGRIWIVLVFLYSPQQRRKGLPGNRMLLVLLFLCAAVVVVVVTGGGTTEPLCRRLSTALSILLAGVRWELRVETASSAEGSSTAVAPPEAGPGRLAPGW